VFIIWKGILPREIFGIGQQGYAAAEPVVYPEGLPVIDCGLGTNPLGMSPRLRELLAGGAGVPDLCVYPAPEPEELKAAIVSAHEGWGLVPDQVLVGGGSMGVLVGLVRLLLRPGSILAGVSPQFTDTILHTLYNGASYVPIRLRAPGYRLEVEDLLAALESGPQVLYLDRPNNPTGQVISLGDLEVLARRGLETGTWVISDEAYGDFLPDEESAAVLDCPNLIVCRSFSKGLGAAGLRVGFALTRDEELAGLFRRIQPPFSVGTLDAALAVEALSDRAFLEETRRYVRIAKERTLDVLRCRDDLFAADTDLRVPIFLLFQEAGSLVRRLAAAGITCEAGSGYFDMDDRSVRLRVPAPDMLEAFLERMARV
jgi:histidinol-phosphate aminotransferase